MRFRDASRYLVTGVGKILFTLVLAAAYSGPVLASSLAARGNSAVGTVPRVHLSDGQIERNIRAKLAKSKISVNRFTVKVSGGVALLEGKTGVIQHKGVATRLAKSGGALAVQNQIQISPEARAKAAARLASYRGGGSGKIEKAVVLRPAAATPMKE